MVDNTEHLTNNENDQSVKFGCDPFSIKESKAGLHIRTINYIIVTTNQAYNNEISLSDGRKITTNTTLESVANINRKVTVVCAPKRTILKKGDEIIIHHNMLRLKYNNSGKVVNDYFIEDNTYFIPPEEVLAYKRNGGEWICFEPFCFVKPIENMQTKDGNILLSALYMEKKFHKGNIKLNGIIRHTNKTLSKRGIKKGDKVMFSPYSEHEFNIDGEILYKMRTEDIIAILD